MPDVISQSFGLWTGVDLFFVISGFLITRTLIPVTEEPSTHRVGQLKQYVIRRIFRLLPAAWLWVLLPVMVMVIMNPAQHLSPPMTLLHDAMAALTNVANVYYPYCYSNNLIGTLCNEVPILGPYWSLSLEEQFYLILPLLMLLIKRRWLIVASIMAVAVGVFWNRPILGFAWYSRLDGLLVGVLIAYFSLTPAYRDLSDRLMPGPQYAVICLLMLLVVGWMGALGGASLASLTPQWPQATSVTALSAGLLVLLASFGKGLTFRTGPIARLLTELGDRSYSLYLCHTPVIHASKALVTLMAGQTPHANLLILACFAALCALCTELTYRYVEVPARAVGKRLAERHMRAQHN